MIDSAIIQLTDSRLAFHIILVMFDNKKDFVLIGKIGATDCRLKTFPVFPDTFSTIDHCFLQGRISVGDIVRKGFSTSLRKRPIIIKISFGRGIAFYIYTLEFRSFDFQTFRNKLSKLGKFLTIIGKGLTKPILCHRKSHFTIKRILVTLNQNLFRFDKIIDIIFCSKKWNTSFQCHTLIRHSHTTLPPL